MIALRFLFLFFLSVVSADSGTAVCNAAAAESLVRNVFNAFNQRDGDFVVKAFEHLTQWNVNDKPRDVAMLKDKQFFDQFYKVGKLNFDIYSLTTAQEGDMFNIVVLYNEYIQLEGDLLSRAGTVEATQFKINSNCQILHYNQVVDLADETKAFEVVDAALALAGSSNNDNVACDPKAKTQALFNAFHQGDPKAVVESLAQVKVWTMNQKLLDHNILKTLSTMETLISKLDLYFDIFSMTYSKAHYGHDVVVLYNESMQLKGNTQSKKSALEATQIKFDHNCQIFEYNQISDSASQKYMDEVVAKAFAPQSSENEKEL